MHLMRQQQKDSHMSLWVIVELCRGTGSFGILYRFLINVIEWRVPEYSLITFLNTDPEEESANWFI